MRESAHAHVVGHRHARHKVMPRPDLVHPGLQRGTREAKWNRERFSHRGPKALLAQHLAASLREAGPWRGWACRFTTTVRPAARRVNGGPTRDAERPKVQPRVLQRALVEQQPR